MRRLTGICLAGAMLAAAPAHAGTTIASEFIRTSSLEAITAPFTLSTGTSSTGMYTGFVEVHVTGTGFSLGSAINDAFYFAGGGNTGSFYKMGIGTSANTLAASDTTTYAAQYIRFIDGVGYVPSGTAPAYDANNSYKFVIDLGALNTKLSFGVLDGQFSDNGGQFNISLWKLRQGGAVPEPGTWLLLIAGFGAVGAAMRRAKTARARVSYAI